MPDTILDPPTPPAHMVESRHRWQHLLGLAVDLAFETDADGRFIFIAPEAPLGWPHGALIGQPSDLLLGENVSGDAFNPFRPTEQLTRRRTWLRCYDGGLAMITVSVAPLRDDTGAIIGARGIGIDMTAGDAQAAQIAGRLRRTEVLRNILSSVGREIGADAMMDATLWTLIRALGAEGAAVIGSPSEDMPLDVLHECGPGASAILADAAHLLTRAKANPTQTGPTQAGPTQPGPTQPGRSHTANVAGRSLLAVGCRTRFGTQAGLTIWCSARRRPWDAEDTMLVESAVTVVRMILDHQAAGREMIHKASTDPLTGLLNRRAFLDEVERHVARLDRENVAGTLMFVDLDAFKAVNDRLGHAVGDQVLVLLATLLRKLVRPGDIVARMGGDEFAVWLTGADHLTAAERADSFCKSTPADLQAALPEPFPDLGVSIGIATRRAGSQEAIEDLTRRADMAMYDVKRSGRRHWRVSLLDGD